MVRTCFLLLSIFCYLNVFSQVCQGNFGDNIFQTGDFGRGGTQVLPEDPGLAPGYIYTTNLPPNDGFYSIVNTLNADQVFGTWVPISDNSGSADGYMMVVNATFEPGLFYEETITNLCEDVLYEFSADIFNLNGRIYTDRILPNVSFLLDDVVFFNTGDVPRNETWNTYGFVFRTAPGQSSIKLSLRNNAPGGIGNDIALDNITFRPCGPTARILPSEVANICEDGEPIDLFATVEGAAFEDVFVQWQQSFDQGRTWQNLNEETLQTYTFNNLRAGDYYYRYLLADSEDKLDNPKCRTNSNTKIVRVIPKFVDVVDSLCVGLSAAIGTDLFNETGIYIDTLQNIIGCDSIVTLDLTIVEEVLGATFTVTDPSCVGFSDGDIRVEFFTNPGPYRIEVENRLFAFPGGLRNVREGAYRYQVTDRYGCELDTTVVLEDPPRFTVDLGPDRTIVLGEEVTLDVAFSDAAVDLLWRPIGFDCELPCETVTTRVSETTNISLFAISVNECEAFDEVTITVDGLPELFIPNVFSPNGDDRNEFFTVFSDVVPEAVSSIVELNIVDRTGREVFKKNSFPAGIPSEGWNGRDSNREASSGVYFYAAIVEFINGQQVTYRGNVLLVR